MFKREVIGEDIFDDMEDNLRKNAFVELSGKTNRKIQAIELLEKAASNFELAGRIKESEVITRIIEHVASSKPLPEKRVIKDVPKELLTLKNAEIENRLYKEYIEQNSGDYISVDENDCTKDAGNLTNHELAAIKHMW